MPDKESTRVSRRSYLKLGAGLMACGASGVAQQNPGGIATLDRLLRTQTDPNRRILLQGGVVLSLDPKVGDFEKADVLIEGKRIAAVGPNLAAAARSALVVNATDRIVMPGFVDTHHHQYETLLRSILADGLLRDEPKNYGSVIQGIFTPVYLPEDAYISELVASLNQINAGVTTTVDTSQVSLSPAHSDACIAGLKESGRRAVFAYSAGVGPASQYPQDITRLRKQYFSSGDQLLTLALHAGVNADQWKLARSVGAPIVSHFISGDLQQMKSAGLLGPDNEYIHCTQLNEATWKLIADTGGKVSIAPAIEMQMRHGMPPFQTALDHGIRPSLSVDVECNMTADMFSIMRAAFTLQRALVNERAIAGEKKLPRLLTSRDTIELATIEGARVAHLDSKIGTLTPGKEADIVMLATDRINVFPMNNVPGTVLTLMDTSNVENVFIAGRVMKWQGRLVGVDLSRIRRTIDTARNGLLARARYPRNFFESCCAPV
ncbi:MAG TPA: amidohydrolase family protein [Bryobacteraceae bacterium]|nr:amidohydrolase family protein [Bryobacteraceae bacterium]